ncbi:MAG TPA: acetate--CoA ligase family protein, partial [Acidimicrobiales bacterium]|nr:acetate--CoA ligase family protein [Acidimicrobiales bacterium]
EGGLEMIVGLRRDPVLGPLVLVGLGGRWVELLGDVAVRLAPLTDADVGEMLRSLRSYPLLTGYRSMPALDVGALSAVVRATSALALQVPAVTEMDLNPVFVLPDGALCPDVRVRMAEKPEAVPAGR